MRDSEIEQKLYLIKKLMEDIVHDVELNLKYADENSKNVFNMIYLRSNTVLKIIKMISKKLNIESLGQVQMNETKTCNKCD